MSSARVQQILSQVLSSHENGTTLPGLLCELCVRTVPVTGAGLSLAIEVGHGGVVATTGGVAEQLEQLQFVLGEGPGVDASSDGQPVLQPDIGAAASVRWPAFGREAIDAGARAMFALPLQVGWVRLGILDLYRDTVGDLDDAEYSEALAFADAAQALLLELNELTPELHDPPSSATEPIGPEPEIHQATGMIAIQAAVGLAEALVLLRARAFSAERTMGEIARDVVAGRIHFRA